MISSLMAYVLLGDVTEGTVAAPDVTATDAPEVSAAAEAVRQTAPAAQTATGGGLDLPIILLSLVILIMAGVIVSLMLSNRKKSRQLARARKARPRRRKPRPETADPKSEPTSADDVHPVTISFDESGRMVTGPALSYQMGKLHGQGARAEQQDSFGVSDASMSATHGQLAVVADGMGGLEDGGRVSMVAVQTILDNFMLVPKITSPLQVLLSLVVEANMAVNEALGQNIKASGSTLVMALVHDSSLSFVSIGDSRIYLYRAGMLTQLNREHVYGRELILKAVNGGMSLYDALTDEQSSALVSYLGMGAIEAIDMPAQPIELIAGDMVILMTDGVYNALTYDELEQALECGDPEVAANLFGQMIEKKAFANQDNYTAVIIGLGS